jgi:cell division inhibitor SulA/protein ImuA
MALEALLRHPALWQGRQQQQSHRETIPTGYPQLDAVLPAHGWPIGALTEIMSGVDGVGELSMLLPALCSLTRQQHWVAFIAPPHIPYAPALTAAGLRLDRTLIVDAGVRNNIREKEQNDFWATEQLLRSGVFSAVILWSGRNSNDRTQRRLQLAAEHGKSWAVCYRPQHVAGSASPAGLRMVLRQHNHQLHADIIKNRGGRLHCLALQQEPERHDTRPQSSVVTALQSRHPAETPSPDKE